ncbi:MAG: type II toxin-antitoxin system VapC family toxin [archaeon]|nr:type II toxin-antitoxin system VapC family toxin [archaeon]
METKAVLDSDILIDFINNKNSAVELIKKISSTHNLFTTDINLFELYYGAYLSKKTSENIETIRGLLGTLNFLSTNQNSMEEAGKICAELEKKGQRIEITDILIGGICLANSLPIATNNKKHFQRMGIKILE